MNHKHSWIWSPRKHGRKGYRFKVCSDPVCGEIKQVSPYGVSFSTSVNKGGKARPHTARLKKWEENLLKKSGETFSEYVHRKFREDLAGG